MNDRLDIMTDFSPLKALLSGSIILMAENAKGYQKEIEGSWNATIRTRKPRAFVKVASVDDVVNTVKFCVENKVNLDKAKFPHRSLLHYAYAPWSQEDTCCLFNFIDLDNSGGRTTNNDVFARCLTFAD